MRLKVPFFRHKAARAAFFASALCTCALGTLALPGSAMSQPVTTGEPGALSGAQPGALLGADEATLRQTFPALRKAARPLPGPRGTRGLWTLSDELVEGMAFETMFFFKAHRLERIEQRRLLAPQVCTRQFDQLTAALEARLGSAVRSSESAESTSRSASWSLETYRIAAFQTPANASCTVMLVHEPLSAKEAAEL
jgi:hypothetical protein